MRFGLIQYGSNKQQIAALTLQDFDSVTVGSGRVGTTKLVTRNAPPGDGNIGLDSATRYVRLFVQVFGGAQQTDIQVVRWTDTTDGLVYAPPVQELQDAIDTLQSRLDAIAGGGPYIGDLNGKTPAGDGSLTLVAADLGAEASANKDVAGGYVGMDDRGVPTSDGVTDINGMRGSVTIPVFKKIRDEAQEDFLAPYVKSASVPQVYTGNVGHRCDILTETDGTNLECNGCTGMIARSNWNGIVIGTGNFRSNVQAGIVKDIVPNDTNASIAWSLQWPNGAADQFLWAGASSLAMHFADASPIYSSDFLSRSVPVGTLVKFKVHRLGNASGVFAKRPGFRNAAFGDLFEKGNGLGDKTMGGTISATDTVNYYPPLFVLASTNEPSVLLIGGSNAGGIGETIANSTGAVGLLSFVAAKCGFINAAVATDRAAWLAYDIGGAPYARYRKALAAYVTHVVIAVGAGDIANGGTPEQAIADCIALATKVKSINPLARVLIGTPPPETLADTVGPPATHNATLTAYEAARVTFSGYVRSVLPLPTDPTLGIAIPNMAALFAGVIDFADILEADASGGNFKRNGGFYKDPTWVNSTGNQITSAGFAAVQAALSPSLFNRYGA